MRFRGVKIGQVSLIGLSGDMYEQEVPFEKRRQYVVVRMQIFGDKVDVDHLNDFVKNNLRARIKSMGITGVNYVEFDFVANANQTPPLPFNWKPEYSVIPSLPNQADEIISGIQKLIGALNDMNIDGTQKKIDTLLSNLNLMLAGDGKGNEGVIESVKQMNIIMARINKATDKEEIGLLVRELVAATTSLRQTITSVQGDTILTIENIKQASENLNEFSRIASQSPSSLIWSDPPKKIAPQSGVAGDAGVKK